MAQKKKKKLEDFLDFDDGQRHVVESALRGESSYHRVKVVRVVNSTEMKIGTYFIYLKDDRGHTMIARSQQFNDRDEAFAHYNEMIELFGPKSPAFIASRMNFNDFLDDDWDINLNGDEEFDFDFGDEEAEDDDWENLEIDLGQIDDEGFDFDDIEI